MLLAVAGSGAGAPAVPPQAERFVPDEVLVKFQPDVDPASVARSVGAVLHDRIPQLDVHILKVPAGAVAGTVLALTNNPLVEYAEPNFVASIQLNPNDPYDNSICFNSPSAGCMTQWAWKTVKAYDGWNVTTGDSVKVAVVDTGIAKSHEDLPPLFAQRNFVNLNKPNNADDNHGHGTHVAGTIGALTNNARGVAGANWTVKLMAVKVLDGQGSGTYAAVANGIIWAADNGAKVINLSLGGTAPSTTLQNALNYAWDKDVVLACAAGNYGDWGNPVFYPAAYGKCIAVAATTSNDSKAYFSEYGASWVDVAAPGVDILSTVPSWTGTSYDAWSGTSMATPHVAGLAGLIWASGRCNGPKCVRSRIEERADPISGTGNLWKWGRINYYNSLKP